MRYFIDRMLSVPQAIGAAIVDGCEDAGEWFVAWLDGADEEPAIKVSGWSKRRDYLNYGPESFERYELGTAPTDEEMRAMHPVLVAEARLREAKRELFLAERWAERKQAHSDAMRARRNRMRNQKTGRLP